MIDFLNSKSSHELIELKIEDRTKLVLDINKMFLKNLCRKTTKTNLIEVKEAIMKFNIYFDKRTKAGLPSCWDQLGNLIPWETYETFLVEAKRKNSSSHGKTTILKGETIVNYLHIYFQLF